MKIIAFILICGFLASAGLNRIVEDHSAKTELLRAHKAAIHKRLVERECEAKWPRDDEQKQECVRALL